MSFESEVARLAAQRDIDRETRRRGDDEDRDRVESRIEEWRGHLVQCVRETGLTPVQIFGAKSAEDTAARRRSTEYELLGAAWALCVHRDYWRHGAATYTLFFTEATHWLSGQYRTNEAWKPLARPTGRDLGLVETWQAEVRGLPEAGGWTVWREGEDDSGVREAALLVAAILVRGDFHGPNERGVYAFVE